MRVFVTGASGFIGQAVVGELLSSGHQVLGLARSDDSAATLTQLGAEVHRGELSQPEGLAAAARACDGVIHTAFIHDFSAYPASAEKDRQAVGAMLGALEGSGKPFVATSVVALLPAGRTGKETDAAQALTAGGLRAEAETMVLEAARRGVRTSAVRLPPSVHGAGDYGFVPALIGIARRTGVSAFIGEGANRWPAVHRLDAARLYRLALEKAEPGARLHAVAEEGVPLREIAALIGERLGVPVRGIPEAEAPAHFAWLARFAGMDNPASSHLTRETLGWHPRELSLLADMRESGYFA